MTPKPPEFQVIATDVDGTLLDSNKMVAPFTRYELQRLTREFGLKVILVSTRMPSSLARVQAELGVGGPVIAYNGALVSDPVQGQLMQSVPLDDDVAWRLIEALLGHAIHVGVFSHERWFVSDLTTGRCEKHVERAYGRMTPDCGRRSASRSCRCIR